MMLRVGAMVAESGAIRRRRGLESGGAPEVEHRLELRDGAGDAVHEQHQHRGMGHGTQHAHGHPLPQRGEGGAGEGVRCFHPAYIPL